MRTARRPGGAAPREGDHPAFEKSHPGIVVKDTTIPYDSLHQKLVTAIAGGQLPDLVRSDIIWVPELANLGVLAPLDQELPDFKSLSAKVFPGPLATNYWKGHYYGLPLDTNTRIWVYNPAALPAVGASGPPKTFAQLKSMSAQAKAKGYYLYAESGTSGWNVCPWIWSNGGSLTNSTYTKATGFLNGPKSVAGIQMLVDLYKAGEMPNIVVDCNGGLGTYDGINQGKYVAMLDGPWSFSIFAGAYKKTSWPAASFPPDRRQRQRRRRRGHRDDEGLEEQGGRRGVHAVHARSYAQTQMARAGQMPVLKTSTRWLVKIHPYYATYLKQIATAKPRTPTPKWTQIDQLITPIAKAFKGERRFSRRSTEAAKQIDGSSSSSPPRRVSSGAARLRCARTPVRRRRRREVGAPTCSSRRAFVLFALVILYPIARAFQISLYHWAIVPGHGQRIHRPAQLQPRVARSDLLARARQHRLLHGGHRAGADRARDGRRRAARRPRCRRAGSFAPSTTCRSSRAGSSSHCSSGTCSSPTAG